MKCDMVLSQIICESCGEQFQPVRKDAKYCSARCRKRAQRQTDKPETEEDLVERLGSDLLSQCEAAGADPKQLLVRLQFEVLKNDLARWDKQMKRQFMVMVMQWVMGDEGDRSSKAEHHRPADGHLH